VLSRPQFLIADLVVTADIDARDRKPTTVKIKQVHWSRGIGHEKWADQTILIDNLTASEGLGQAGEYIVPLVQGQGTFRVAVTPPSPGFSHQSHPGERDAGRVYPSTPSTRAQLDQIRTQLGQP
jgi:hypothetical protein